MSRDLLAEKPQVATVRLLRMDNSLHYYLMSERLPGNNLFSHKLIVFTKVSNSKLPPYMYASTPVVVN